MLKSAHFWIEKLDLLKHPEGGWYREIYRSEDMVSQAGLPAGFGGDRNFCTSIYYLLEGDDYSAFHRIKSDEIWHFYIGTSAVEIIVIENGLIKKMHLGNIPEKRQTLQVIVTKKTWFAAKLLNPEGFALAGCTVSPGFHFEDFEIAGENLLYEFFENKDEILPLLKENPHKFYEQDNFYSHFLLLSGFAEGQLAEVQARYNGVGDVDFVAYNNTSVPLFLNIDFADLENTTFNEPLPYIKLLQPGFNSLFTLHREPGAEAPRFNHQIKIFQSNPWSLADLDFPYLIPLAPGEVASVFNVKSLKGFLRSEEPQSWNATGFLVEAGQPVFAARTGLVVEIVEASRKDDPQTWYHSWNYSITLLQPDGTLICYRNILPSNKKLKVGEKIFAGQTIGNVVPSAGELIVVIFQHSLNSADLRFIIPQFASENQTGVLLTSLKYKVVHSNEIRGLEMSSREKRRYLK